MNELETREELLEEQPEIELRDENDKINIELDEPVETVAPKAFKVVDLDALHVGVITTDKVDAADIKRIASKMGINDCRSAVLNYPGKEDFRHLIGKVVKDNWFIVDQVAGNYQQI